MDFSLRVGNEADLPFIRDAAREAYSIYVERIGREPAPMVADFSAAIESGHLEVMEADGKAVGFCVSWFEDDHLFIENVVVLPGMQGKGVARKLFDILEARARDADEPCLRLYTNAKMTENLALYPHLGFTVTDRRIEDGFDRVFFAKRLGA